jgi:hypothetical protein
MKNLLKFALGFVLGAALVLAFSADAFEMSRCSTCLEEIEEIFDECIEGGTDPGICEWVFDELYDDVCKQYCDPTTS